VTGPTWTPAVFLAALGAFLLALGYYLRGTG
jgi:hypothetical protein